MINIFGYQIETTLFWTIALGVPAVLIALFAWILPRRARLRKEDEVRIQNIEKETKEANENIKLIEKHFGIPIYVDGLTSAPPSVFDPFAKGLKLMTEYKWDEAIDEFKKSMKDAKTSQLVALYNLMGLCYDTPGNLDLALKSYNESLNLAREFNDKVGEAKALGNLGLIYYTRGDLDNALRYHEDALKIDREIGNKEGESQDLGNIGLIYETRGDLDKTLEYQEEALKIDREISNKEGEAQDLENLGSMYQTRGDLDKALKYYEDALKIEKEISDSGDRATTLSKLGSIYETRGDLDKALEYQEEALKIDRVIGNKEEEAQALGNLGMIY